MPPLQALAALHGIWILALMPGLLWVWRTWQPSRLRLVGWVLIFAGVTGMSVVAGHEWLTWYPSVPETEHRYFLQRILFMLATITDVPLVQFLLAGVVTLFVGRRRQPMVLTLPLSEPTTET
jgi:hypothetical protein